MDIKASSKNVNGGVVPQAKASAIQTNQIQQRGSKTVRVGSGRVVTKPLTFTMTNATDNDVNHFIGSSLVAIARLGSLGTIANVSTYSTIAALAQAMGDETWFVNGFRLQCSTTGQFSASFRYVQANNGSYVEEALEQEILLAQDGDNYRDDVLDVNFADGRLLPFNKNTGFAVTVIPGAGDADNTYYVTLKFAAVEDKVMADNI